MFDCWDKAAPVHMGCDWTGKEHGRPRAIQEAGRAIRYPELRLSIQDGYARVRGNIERPKGRTSPTTARLVELRSCTTRDRRSVAASN